MQMLLDCVEAHGFGKVTEPLKVRRSLLTDFLSNDAILAVRCNKITALSIMFVSVVIQSEYKASDY